ncbi:MAG: fused MFS/spermidine synthase [Planctomycetaceae bacterium]|nr:fused MFS/spermidine synthase [Planctomycetaceae bacterium]
MPNLTTNIKRFSAATILSSALLLFLIQPIVSKSILGWFGGAPNVWTTCMLFFQSVLVIGYAYAHMLSSLPMRRQVVIHMCVLLAALITLPVVADVSWQPDPSSNPTLAILQLLLIHVGMSYFVLSTTGPLVQSWFARSLTEGTPYRLYALSSVGSLAALIAYPLFVEVMFDTTEQGWIWSIGFIGFAIFIMILGRNCFRAAPATQDINRTDSTPRRERTPPRQLLKWIALACLPSILLLAITDQLTQDVAVTPFLWVLPLAIYLISFIICFDRPAWFNRSWYATATTLLILVLSLLYIRESVDAFFGGSLMQTLAESLIGTTALMAATLFAICMLCHGELYQLRPAKSKLTQYYVAISIGGALGGFFVSIICPILFNQYHEFHLGLVIAFSAAAVLLLRLILDKPAVTQLAVALPLGLAFGIVLISQWGMTQTDALVATRNFYGVLQVTTTDATESTPAIKEMRHGRVVHGAQLLNPLLLREPTTYYGRKSGIGLVFNTLYTVGLSGTPAPLNIAAVGLGTGTLAVYPTNIDQMTYFEINPDVIQLAKEHFTFLQSAAANVKTTTIDGRLGVATLPQHSTDLLILDAFSSDSIPTHLLTVEAFEIYLDRLRTNGVVCIHISNQHLDLTPVLAGIAARFDLSIRTVQSYEKITAIESTDDALWCILTANSIVLASLDHQVSVNGVGPESAITPWTDRYSNLLGILK